jgi:hypothetical protein
MIFRVALQTKGLHGPYCMADALGRSASVLRTPLPLPIFFLLHPIYCSPDASGALPTWPGSALTALHSRQSGCVECVAWTTKGALRVLHTRGLTCGARLARRLHLVHWLCRLAAFGPLAVPLGSIWHHLVPSKHQRSTPFFWRPLAAIGGYWRLLVGGVCKQMFGSRYEGKASQHQWMVWLVWGG